MAKSTVGTLHPGNEMGTQEKDMGEMGGERFTEGQNRTSGFPLKKTEQLLSSRVNEEVSGMWWHRRIQSMLGGKRV